MRAFKILGFAIGGLIALLVLALLAVWLFVDPNDYKDRISAAVKDSTGRSLSLPGKLKLSVFPWISLETGEASLGNPAGFGDEPFLTLKRSSMSVKLMPLLHKQLEVGRIEIDGLDLKLKQNSAGKGNWEDWGSKEPAAPEKPGQVPGLNLAGVSIKDSRLAFEGMVASDVKVDIGHVAPGVAIPVAISLNLVSTPNTRPMPLKAQFELTLDLDQQRYQLAKLDLQGDVQPAGAPKPLAWKFTSPAADLNLSAQTLADTTFTAQVGAAKLAGRIAGSKLIDAPALNGSFQLAELAPRDLMAQFGIAAPVTRDKSALASFAAQGAYAWQGGVARMNDLKLKLDESQLSGRFAYNTANSGMDFALNLDRIDLDRYQPPPVAGETAKAEPIELPVDLLKALRAKGSFNVGQIKVGGAHLTQLSAAIDVADAQARFAPLAAKLYGGSYSGNIGLDMRQATPRLTMDEHLSGIDIAALMKEYADSKRLSGRGNLDVKLAGLGRNGAALLKTLTGTISTDLQNGAVEGVDIWYAIAQAQSLIQKRQLAAATNTKRTAFENFKTSADVVNGVATTKDLLITSQLLRITGAGSTNLVTQALDYKVTATVLKTPPGADEGTAQLARASIPVNITGTLEDPKVRPDLAGMAKERVKQEVEKHKDEVKEKVKNKLKGLFGK
ncbi:MAG TPA: AsmA family protein [Steroidobacteraceae bacterium]|nr:AsmA family protein [Steroidobacteraceae bacterium]